MLYLLSYWSDCLALALVDDHLASLSEVMNVVPEWWRDTQAGTV